LPSWNLARVHSVEWPSSIAKEQSHKQKGKSTSRLKQAEKWGRKIFNAENAEQCRETLRRQIAGGNRLTKADAQGSKGAAKVRKEAQAGREWGQKDF